MEATLGNGNGDNGFRRGGVSRGGRNQEGSDSSRNLHGRKCAVCRHPRREDIETDFLAWRSPKEMVKEYKLWNRMALYRHAHAFGLMEKRYVNMRAALARIIEKAGEVPVTAWSVVAAVRACAKINARGQWMERGESNPMRDLLDGMSQEELLAYAEKGTLPDWFRGTDVMEHDPSVGSAALRAREGGDA